MLSHAFIRATARRRNFCLYRSFHFLSTLQLLSCKVCPLKECQSRDPVHVFTDPYEVANLVPTLEGPGSLKESRPSQIILGTGGGDRTIAIRSNHVTYSFYVTP